MKCDSLVLYGGFSSAGLVYWAEISSSLPATLDSVGCSSSSFSSTFLLFLTGLQNVTSHLSGKQWPSYTSTFSTFLQQTQTSIHVHIESGFFFLRLCQFAHETIRNLESEHLSNYRTQRTLTHQRADLPQRSAWQEVTIYFLLETSQLCVSVCVNVSACACVHGCWVELIMKCCILTLVSTIVCVTWMKHYLL